MIMQPPPATIILSATARLHKNVPRAFTAKILSHSAAVVSWMTFTREMPALLTSTSMRS